MLDFGIARAVDSDARSSGKTEAGRLLGTLTYMSPEQTLADPLEVDTRTAGYLCTRVWRNLTMDECRFYAGESIPYERTCPDLPPDPNTTSGSDGDPRQFLP